MDEPHRDAFSAWKEADARARGAELKLALAWDDYFAHRGGPPARELVGEVSRLRGEANQKLTAAMQILRERSRSGSERPMAR
jgi:hypothetical protein